jgi:acyl carrier protein
MSHPSVVELLALVLDVEPHRVTPTTTRTDIDEWDSLAQLTVVSALEETYGVVLTTEQMNQCIGVSEISTVLAGHGVVVA